jgi:hypothetical protein
MQPQPIRSATHSARWNVRALGFSRSPIARTSWSRMSARRRRRGPILAAEHPPLVAAVGRVRGAKRVEDRLQVHADAAEVPALQGGTPRTGERGEFLQRYWSPSARLAAGAAGLVLVRRAGLLGLIGASPSDMLGLTLLARALANRPLRELDPDASASGC